MTTTISTKPGWGAWPLADQKKKIPGGHPHTSTAGLAVATRPVPLVSCDGSRTRQSSLYFLLCSLCVTERAEGAFGRCCASKPAKPARGQSEHSNWFNGSSPRGLISDTSVRDCMASPDDLLRSGSTSKRPCRDVYQRKEVTSASWSSRAVKDQGQVY
jgi:hypothetical protein